MSDTKSLHQLVIRLFSVGRISKQHIFQQSIIRRNIIAIENCTTRGA